MYDVTARNRPLDANAKQLFDHGFSSGWIMQCAPLVNSPKDLFNAEFLLQ